MGCGSSVALDPDPVLPVQKELEPAASIQNLDDIDPGENIPKDDLPECRLRIFHVNDVYTLENFPLLRSCIDAMSEDLPNSNVLVTLGGDFLGPSLLSSVDHGRGAVAIMNAIPVHAVCFGNHECDVPFLSMCQRVQEFQGVWLNSNIPTFSEEKALSSLADNHVMQLAEGRSVALIGLLCGGGKDASLYRQGAFNGHAAKIVPVLKAVDGAVARVRTAHPNIDCIIPMTHQEMPDDIEMTKRGHNFPVILGGHDHHVFNEVHNNTHIVKAGADIFNVAVVDIVWDKGPAGSEPTKVSVQMVPLATPPKYNGPPLELIYKPDPAVLEEVQKRQRPAEELKEATLAVFEADGSLTSMGVRLGERSMATLICTALRDVAGGDGAVINAGSIRGNKAYTDGKVRFADLNAECPYPSSQIVVKIPGAILFEAIAESRAPWRGAASATHQRADSAGPGASRDALHCDDGMKVDPNTSMVFEVAGQPFDPDRMYRIVIDSFIMRTNVVFKRYAEAHPEEIPSDESGQPALPLLVQYFCNRIWASLCDVNKDGTVEMHEIDEFFDEADTDGNGEIDLDELMVAMSFRLGDLDVSRILAQQCIGFADADKNGTISKQELRTFIESEIIKR